MAAQQDSSATALSREQHIEAILQQLRVRPANRV
jgi:hypothetical protein